MNELQLKWIEELRATNHEQGYGAMLRGNRYCLLGLLIKCYNPELLTTCVSTLPDEVVTAACMASSLGEINPQAKLTVRGTRIWSVAQLNDNLRTDFKSFATLLETCPFLFFKNIPRVRGLYYGPDWVADVD